MDFSAGPYRLVTQSDFDGVISAALLRSRGIVEKVKFVHPRDVQERLVELSANDIAVGLPYVKEVAAAFDHHLSESLKHGTHENYIVDPDADSSARVIWNYFGGVEAFPGVAEDLMTAVDRASSGRFTIDEVLGPTGWTLLYFVTDARTGLGRWGSFRLSNQQLLFDLMEYCVEHTIDEILELPDVAERVALYREHEPRFRDQILRCITEYHNVLIVDLTGEDDIFAGNRFVKYALFPHASCSVQIGWGFERQNLLVTASKSIFNRTCSANIGALLTAYGGGGHADAGTAQAGVEMASEAIEEIVERLSVAESEDGAARYRYKGPAAERIEDGHNSVINSDKE